MFVLSGRSARPGRYALPAAFAIAALAGALACRVSPEPAAAATGTLPAIDTAWQTVWRDDFTGPPGTGPARGTWQVDLGHGYPGGPAQWGTGEIEEYTANPANLALDGLGDLRMTATRTPAGAWRSARVETLRSDFQPAAGGRLRIEARIQLPDGGDGYWPAFWAIGAPFRAGHVIWPSPGEIDVMENVDDRPMVWGTLHCGVVETGGPCHEDTGLSGGYRLPAAAGAAGFHVYTVVWSTAPARLDWYVDGRPFWSVTPAMTGDGTWRATFDHGFFLLLDLAVGGGWPGLPTAGTRAGQSMLVDYVSVSRGRASTVLPPVAAALPTASPGGSPLDRVGRAPGASR